MTTAAPFIALATIQPVLTGPELLALAGYLAGYRGLTREAYALDLCQFATWRRSRPLGLFDVRRADIESFARDLEARDRAAAGAGGVMGWRDDHVRVMTTLPWTCPALQLDRVQPGRRHPYAHLAGADVGLRDVAHLENSRSAERLLDHSSAHDQPNTASGRRIRRTPRGGIRTGALPGPLLMSCLVHARPARC